MHISEKLGKIFVIIGLFLLWAGLHLPSLMYGINNLPLHQSYVGDEQSPVNGALHVLDERSLFGLRNLKTLYYGPVFSMFAIPAIGADFGVKYLSNEISSIKDYEQSVLWDWGGIVRNGRFISIIIGFLGLYFLFQLLMLGSINSRKNIWLAVLGTMLLASNFYFFEYSAYFKHWIFVLTGLIIQTYLLFKTFEDINNAQKYFIWQGIVFSLTFGISYLSSLSQVIFLPALYIWYKEKKWRMLQIFGMFMVGSFVACVAIIAWHPRAFLRLINLTGGDISGLGFGDWTTEARSLGFSFVYYAKIIFINQLSLVVAWLTIIISLYKKIKFTNIFFWIPIISGITYYIIFGLMGHHESRYITPVILSLILSVCILMVKYYYEIPRLAKIASLTLIFSYFVFHLITIGFWTQKMIIGPSEKPELLKAVEYQKENPESKQLYFSWYILGYPHTKAAYKNYMDSFGKSEVNLYKHILTAEYNKDTTPINVYYTQPLKNKKWWLEAKNFDRVVYQYRPQIENNPGPDYPEVDLTRYWVQNIWQDEFYVLKE